MERLRIIHSSPWKNPSVMNIKNLDVHNEDDFRYFLKLAGRTIECSWFIGAIRHHSDMRWVPLIMFGDETHKKFCYAFELNGGGAEIEAFIGRLRKVSEQCDSENDKESER